MFIAVGRDYARVLGLPMLGGRDFTDAELAGSSERVAIIDDMLAQRLWPRENALGRMIQFLDGEESEAQAADTSCWNRSGREALARQSPAICSCVRAAWTALRECA